MIDDDKWYFVSGILADMEKQSDIFSAAHSGLMIPPESPLIDPQYKTESLLIAALSFLVGDYYNNIEWYVYECDYGRDAKEAGCPGNMKSIDTHDRLRWLIEIYSWQLFKFV